jgi:drug/metabolite transporter (DMT)-like permease
METRSLGSELILFLVAALWGLAFVAQRVGMEYLGPLTFNGVRFLLGALSLMPLIFARRSQNKRTATQAVPGFAPSVLSLPLSALLVPCLIGGLILTVAANLQQASLQYIAASKASFITGLYVVLVPIAGLTLGRKTPIVAWVGCAVAAVGLYFLSIGEGFAIAKGDLIALSSTIFWTAHILFLDTFAKRVDPVELSAGQFFVCGALTLGGAFIFEVPSITGIRAAIVPILYGGLFSIGIAYTLQAVAQRKAHPARAAIIMSLESVFGAIGGVLILGERLSRRETLGCALMFAGMLISQAPTPAKHGSKTPKA